jgi:hypothetical protein
MLEENRRTFLIGVTAVVIALVVIGGFLLFRGDPESKLSVDAVPNDLTLSVDGHQVATTGEIKLKAGEHTLTGERQGFQTYSQTVTARGGYPIDVKIYLYANSAEGREWAEKHPAETSKAEEEAGRRYDEINERLREKYPIIASLPYLGPGFEANYGASKSDPKNPEAISIVISTYTPDGKTKALQWIQGNGWDPATLDIIYTTTS